ncbi:MAG: hypothetical protein Q4B03_06825 [Lachnospiraceae bacterium]|nr:hypothetical protein [Lachnospiraceae bacterium]
MTLVNILGTAAGYTAVAAISAFGLFFFGAMFVRMMSDTLHHA